MKFGPGCKKVHESGKENVDRVNFIKAFSRKHNKNKKARGVVECLPCLEGRDGVG